MTNVKEAFINSPSGAAEAFRRHNYKEETPMNKTELIAAIAAKSELTKKDAEKALSAFEATVTEVLVANGRVQLVGFGTFDVAERAARDGRNPQTGEKMKIKASKSPRFKVGKKLRDAVNETPKPKAKGKK